MAPSHERGAALGTRMPQPTRPGTELTNPLLVVRAAGDGVALARGLAAHFPGESPESGLDLRTGGAPVLPAEVAREARAVAAEDPARNLDRRRRREDDLVASLDLARSSHQIAREEADARSVLHHQLLQSATWCEERSEIGASLSAALFEAEADLEAAQARVAEAEARVASVAEQHSAAEAVVEDAQRQLLELDVAGKSENEVRRSLEHANQAARDANDAANAARAEADAVAQALAEAKARCEQLEADRASLRQLTLVDPAPVIAAYRRAESVPLVDPDDATLALADDLERRLAELEALGDPPQAPTVEEVDAAETTVATARDLLAELRQPVSSQVPEWWDELAALHAEVVDAETAAGSRMARGSSRKRLEEALAAERVLLDRLGLPSHLDALMTGGRPQGARANPRAIPEAEEAVARGEARLHALYDVEATVAAHRRVRADILRVRSLSAALLGIRSAEVSPARLRQMRPDPDVATDLAAALAVAEAPPVGSSLIERAAAWLAERESAVARLAALDADCARVVATAEGLASRADAAAAGADELAATARTARRQVEVLEAEMVNRMRPGVDPATRAATAAAIRDHIAALEARISTAKNEAEAAHAAATATMAPIATRFDEARRDQEDLARRAASAAALLRHQRGHAGDLLSDLGALAIALRAEDSAIDGSLSDLAESVAAAAAAESEIEVALLEHRARPSGDPEPDDHADALRRLLEPASRPSDVVLDPTAGLPPGAEAPVLATLLELGATRPILVVATTETLLTWANSLLPEQGSVVSEDDLHLVPFGADESSDR